MIKKSVLGRGLDSLLPKAKGWPEEKLVRSDRDTLPAATVPIQDTNTDTDYIKLQIGAIERNPKQPRKDFDQSELKSLSDSIKTDGILQPIVVKALGNGKYQIVAGERRWQAAQMAGLAVIPAVIAKKSGDLDELVAALLENLQRSDLNPIEEAEAFDRLSSEFSISHEAIAQRMGRSRAAVSNAIRLLALPDEIKLALREHKVMTGQVRPLLALDPVAAIGIFRELCVHNWSAREVERRVHALTASASNRETAKKTKGEKNPSSIAQAHAEDRLVKTWGRAVKIVGDDNGGHVRFDYYSKADLIDLVERLLASR